MGINLHIGLHFSRFCYVSRKSHTYGKLAEPRLKEINATEPEVVL